MLENDYELVIAKIPKTNDSGRDVSNDDYGAGGKRDSEGKISALAYDFQPYEEKESEENQLSELASAGVVALISLGIMYYIGSHKEEIKVGLHKVTRFAKSKLLKMDSPEEEVFANESILLNKQILKMRNARSELLTRHKKSARYHFKLISESLNQLSDLIDKYNANNKYYSASFLLYYAVPLREYILSFEAIFNQRYDKWNKVMSKLDLNAFLEEIRLLLQKEGGNAEIITLFDNLDENQVIETIRRLMNDDQVA